MDSFGSGLMGGVVLIDPETGQPYKAASTEALENEQQAREDLAASLPTTYAVKVGGEYHLVSYGLAVNGFDSALAAAASAANAAGGGDVIIPAGTHLTNGTNENVATTYGRVRFLGVGGAIVKLNPSTPVTSPVMLPLRGTHVTVSGIEFDCSGITNSTCVRIYGAADDITVKGCTFDKPGSGGVYVDTGVIANIKVTGNHFNGARYGVLTHSSSTVDGIEVIGNTFRGDLTSGGDAVEINTPAGRATNVVVSGNRITAYGTTSSNGMGIGVAHADSITINGNTIDNCELDGIHVEDGSRNVTIVGNTVTNCQRSGIIADVGVGISEDPNLSCRIVISSNVVTNCGTVLGQVALGVESGTDAPAAQDAIICDNIVRGCGRAGAATYTGISVGYRMNRAVLSGNIVTNTKGVLAYGIAVAGSTSVMVIGNTATDDQGIKTQTYGLRVYGSTATVQTLGNSFAGNLTGTVTVEAGSVTDLLAAPARGQHQLAVGDSTLSRTEASAAATVSSGAVRLVYFTATATETVSTIRLRTGSTAAAATPTMCKVGLYSVASNGDLTLIASSANNTALFSAANTNYTIPLLASVTKVQGQRYAVGVLVTSATTMPNFAGITLLADTGVQPWIAGALAASGGDLPSSAIAASLASSGNAIYAAVA